ncbi:MAG: glycoside hydrolase [Nitrososphaeraceae archaeon]|nr:glycoside hydrolase [Nitrososphaeraceae archaeon]
MHSKIGIFLVFLFATVLLVPVSTSPLVNAQGYNDNQYYHQDFYKKDNYLFEDNNQPDYNDKNGRDYYYHYPSKDKQFNQLVQECEDCFLQELYYQLSDKQRYFFFDAIEYEFGSLEKLCKLIVNYQISEQELKDILRHILVQLFDKVGYDNDIDKINSYYSYDKYDNDYYKSIPSQKIDEIINNIIECLFPNPIIYVVWQDDATGSNDIFFAASTDNGHTFSTPENLSNNLGNSITPQIAAEGDNVYVVWRDNTPGNFDTFISVSNDNGHTFSTPKNLSYNLGDSNDQQIASEGDNVYVVWRDNTPGNFDIFFSVSNDNGHTFSTPKNLSYNLGDSSFPQIASEGDNVYVVWVDGISVNFDILFSSSTNNGKSFSPPDVISDNTGQSSPQIAAKGDNVFVVWSGSTPVGTDILFSFSTNNGKSFSPPDNISNTPTLSIFPQIAIKGYNVYLVWEDRVGGDNNIFISFSTNNGKSFSPPDNISDNIGISGRPQIVAKGDNVYSVWEDNTPSPPGILFSFSTNNGKSFSQPNDISGNIGPSLNPHIAAKGNNVYVVWEDIVQGSKDILFSFSTNNGRSFSQPDDISNSPGNSNSPEISVW